MTRPALVLLSKADGFKQLCVQQVGNLRGGTAEDWAARFDGDPMGRLSRAEHVGARWIIKAFDRAFKRFRVDFVTAFDGHDEFPERDPEHRNIRYNMKSPHYGVADNFNWLKREIDRSRNPIFRRLDPGVWPAIAAHAGRLMRLQRQLEALLPDYMAAACKVANLKGEDLLIHVESAGRAVKLRQAVPSLLADFARAGVILRDIKVKVAVPEYRPPAPPVQERHVSESTRSGLGALAASLPADSPLARALKRFVKSAG